MKKHNFKTRSLAILSLPLILAVLAGCGATQSQSSQNDPSSGTSSSSNPPLLGGSNPGNPTLGDTAQSTARFNWPEAIALDSKGNIIVGDTMNSEVRLITPSDSGGNVTTLYGPSAGIYRDAAVTVEQNGVYYVANPHKIFKITSDGAVSIFAGSGSTGASDGQGQTASFNFITGMAFDSNGNMFVADSQNNEIRRITPSGLVTTFAGSVTAGNSDGVGNQARFNTPWGVVVDSNNNVFVSDNQNDEIRKITTEGYVTTFVGSGAGDENGVGNQAKFCYPAGLTIDKEDNIYVADDCNQEIRKITPDALVSTVLGFMKTGSADGCGRDAEFSYPMGIAIDAANQYLYVADTQNDEIRRVSILDGCVVTIAGHPTVGNQDGTAINFLP